MNQPKFKFGDKVADGSHIFYINHIKHDLAGFWYRETECSLWTPENRVNLYQEPQKKKLYAHKVCIKLGTACFGGRGIPPMFQTIWAEGESLDFPFLNKRSPEDDIEYPESK